MLEFRKHPEYLKYSVNINNYGIDVELGTILQEYDNQYQYVPYPVVHMGEELTAIAIKLKELNNV